jgi:hypothetical protein
MTDIDCISAPRRVRQPLTPERRRVYLQTLRETGSKAAAAAAASPHCAGQRHCDGQAGSETFRQLIRTDPTFAAEVEAALEFALGNLEKEVARRCFIPDTRPVADRSGAIVGTAVSWNSANNLALRTLARLDPASWSEKRQMEGNLTMSAVPSQRQSDFVLNLEDVSKLNDDEQRSLFDILEKLTRADSATPSDLPMLPGPATDIE